MSEGAELQIENSNGSTNGGVHEGLDENQAADDPQQLDPEMLKKIAALRTHVHESFGKIALAMVALPRYRHLAIGDLAHLVMEPPHPRSHCYRLQRKGR